MSRVRRRRVLYSHDASAATAEVLRNGRQVNRKTEVVLHAKSSLSTKDLRINSPQTRAHLQDAGEATDHRIGRCVKQNSNTALTFDMRGADRLAGQRPLDGRVRALPEKTLHVFLVRRERQPAELLNNG